MSNNKQIPNLNSQITSKFQNIKSQIPVNVQNNKPYSNPDNDQFQFTK